MGSSSWIASIHPPNMQTITSENSPRPRANVQNPSEVQERAGWAQEDFLGWRGASLPSRNLVRFARSTQGNHLLRNVVDTRAIPIDS